MRRDEIEKLGAEVQDRTPDAAVDAVVDRVAAFVGRAPQHDDMTVMLVTIPPAPAA
jgi:serine phosphatase RsbU (regulator of sigma subunit)